MSRINTLRTEFDHVRTAITAIEQRAEADGGRELTEAEQADVDQLFTRASALSAEITPLAERHDSILRTAEVLSRVAPTEQTRSRTGSSSAPAAKLPTAAEYFAAFFRANAPDPTQRDDSHWRVLAEQINSDVPGLLPTPIVGDLIKEADSRRPLFDSLTARPMPNAGKTFERPRVTQRTNAGEQSAELDELTSRKMTVVLDSVSKRTFGGALELSQQNIDWTDPAALSIALGDFVEMYNEVTEDAACTFLETTASATGTWDDGTVQGILTSLTDAAVAVYGTCKKMPDTVWIALDRWADLASYTDANDRPVFPGLGGGTLDLKTTELGSPVGLNFVVAPQLTAGKIIVGTKSKAEAYEQRRGLLQATLPTILGVDIAYFGYVAFYGRSTGFVSLA